MHMDGYLVVAINPVFQDAALLLTTHDNHSRFNISSSAFSIEIYYHLFHLYTIKV